MGTIEKIETALIDAGWEKSTSGFDAFYKSEARDGRLVFVGAPGESFIASVDRAKAPTPHYICMISGEIPTVQHVWIDPQTLRFCIHDGKNTVNNPGEIPAEIFSCKDGMDRARLIAGNPSRVTFAQYGDRSRRCNHPILAGGY